VMPRNEYSQSPTRLRKWQMQTWWCNDEEQVLFVFSAPFHRGVFAMQACDGGE
jgi:hypothetical protein